MDRDERQIQTLQLAMVSGLGPRLMQNLLSRFESIEEILSASKTELMEVNGVGSKLADAIHRADDSHLAEQEWDRCEANGVKLLFKHSDDYPSQLADICDAPNVLYCQGDIIPQDNLAVGIVGSRRCTLYGRQQAEKLAGALARAGFTVVSGLARGIDAAAHRGAIKAGGRTIAVMATGLSHIYPPEHVELAEEVAHNGALVSESFLDQKPLPGLFPQRNRIISGLSLGALLIEATAKSGALHTARHAMEQGREVMAIPGRIDSLASEGCHSLLRDGATLVRNIDDILESLGPLTKPVKRGDDDVVHLPQELNLNDLERQVLNRVSSDPIHVDEVLRQSEIEASRVLSTLTILEMKRVLRRLPGGYLVRG